jgi:phosphatidylserine decarboxylase
MSIRPEVLPFIGVSIAAAGIVIGLCRLVGLRRGRAVVPGALAGLLLIAYMLYFFRDPPRVSPSDPSIVVAGADGKVAGIKVLSPDEMRSAAAFCGLEGESLHRFTQGKTVRISIFLSLFDVHVNRAPISGQSQFLGYFAGQHIFTFKEKSSDVNQHNSILISNDRTACLFNQIVGPVARRVVYWPDHDHAVAVRAGDPIGMMKFGSRLDVYFPENDVVLVSKVGDVVRAGETVMARLNVERAQ